MSDVKYLSTTSPTLTIKLAGRRVTAVGGVLHLDAAQEADLEQLLKTRPDVRAQIRKIDIKEAEAQAVKALEAIRKNPTAVKGPVTSTSSASNQIREARQAQTSEALTGKVAAVNVNTEAKDTKTVEVTELQTAKPATPSFLGKTQK